MQLHILSDLHLEFLYDFQNYNAEDVGADVLVLAGDIGLGTGGIEWAGKQALRFGIPVVYVAGNHEYYHHDIESCMLLMRRAATREGVHLLENDSVVIGGIRFLGATLWTNFSASGHRTRAMAVAAHRISDHRVIKLGGRLFRPEDAAALHGESVSWLTKQLNTPFAGKTVVVTHHGPTSLAQHPAYSVDHLSAAFWTDLRHLFEKADLWIYGHTHSCLDQVLCGTRVVSNQAGYRRSSQSPPEDPRFDPRFVVDL